MKLRDDGEDRGWSRMASDKRGREDGGWSRRPLGRDEREVLQVRAIAGGEDKPFL